MPRKQVLGVLGGGQLGMMLQEANTSELPIELVFLDPDSKSPAKQICASDKHVTGKFTDEASIRALAEKCDLLTIETEHVNTEALRRIKQEGRVKIFPDPDDIELIRDKYCQKEQLRKSLGEDSVAEQYPVASDVSSIIEMGKKLQYPFLLKSRTDAYDGRGNFVVCKESVIGDALEALSDRPLYAEKMIKFERELAVMVVKTQSGEVYSYPCVETKHENNICKIVYAPARIPLRGSEAAHRLAEKAVKNTFVGAGIFGVELFQLSSGKIMLNEIAPRPHNSGHYTIEACNISQYEALLRVVLGMDLPPDFTAQPKHAIMYNLLGSEDPLYVKNMCKRAKDIRGATIHLYGKKESPGRKMGHITILSNTMADCVHSVQELVTGDAEKAGSTVKVLVCMGSESDRPKLQGCFDALEFFGVGYHEEIISAHRTPKKMYYFAENAERWKYRIIIAAAGGAAHLPGMIASLTPLPVIGIPIDATAFKGKDALLSIVQMPRGEPVATVYIEYSTEAALLAIRMLGVADVRRYRQMKDKVACDMARLDCANVTRGATAAHSLRNLITENRDKAGNGADVLVCMRSISDRPGMQGCFDVLTSFGIGYHEEVMGTAQTSGEMQPWAEYVEYRGYKIIIAAAGSASDLPSTIAMHTPLPVFSVPFINTALDVEESFLRTVQTPRDVPIGITGVGNSTNAALLAIRVLGIANQTRLRQIKEKTAKDAAQVLAVAENLSRTFHEVEP